MSAAKVLTSLLDELGSASARGRRGNLALVRRMAAKDGRLMKRFVGCAARVVEVKGVYHLTRRDDVLAVLRDDPEQINPATTGCRPAPESRTARQQPLAQSACRHTPCTMS